MIKGFLSCSHTAIWIHPEWDISDYLTEDLLMAYKEPLILRLDRTRQPWEYPRLRDNQQTVFELAELWEKMVPFSCLEVRNCGPANWRQKGHERNGGRCEGAQYQPTSRCGSL